MTDPPEHRRRPRQRLEAISRRLPWAMRTDLDRTSRSLQSDIETLNGLVQSLLESGHANAIRWEHLDNHLVQMSNDLTATIASHLVENAASHDVLAERMAHSESVLRTVAPLVGGIAARRRELHDSLAWFPTWSALAPLAVEPLVSVIVPTRNRRSLLEHALASLSRQSYTKWEALVVNDGSTDDTEAFLRMLSTQDDRIRVVEATGVGPGGARQRGLERADGDVIAYLDDDNLMSDGWLRAVVEVLGRRPEVDAVYGAQLREIDAAEPWLLLEPFDELRLLEGNFIDIGAVAHRPLDGVAHRHDVRGLEDWDFLLSVSERCALVALPVVASVYLTRAAGRRTVAADESDVEEYVRSSAVRRRLADAEFVDRAIRSIVDDDPLSDVGSPGSTAGRDVEMLVSTFRNISQRCDGPIRILEWGVSDSSEILRSSLRDVEVQWLRMQEAAGHLGDVTDSADIQQGGARFDGSAGDPRRVREALEASTLTEVWFDGDAETGPEDVGPASHAGRYVLFPTELGIDFDVVVIDGPTQRECLRRAREIVSPAGLVLLHGPDPSWHHSHVDEFTSWRPIGDAFWVGSAVDTDFTDVVPFRALLRGMRRTRQHAQTPPTH